MRTISGLIVGIHRAIMRCVYDIMQNSPASSLDLLVFRIQKCSGEYGKLHKLCVVFIRHVYLESGPEVNHGCTSIHLKLQKNNIQVRTNWLSERTTKHYRKSRPTVHVGRVPRRIRYSLDELDD